MQHETLLLLKLFSTSERKKKSENPKLRHSLIDSIFLMILCDLDVVLKSFHRCIMSSATITQGLCPKQKQLLFKKENIPLPMILLLRQAFCCFVVLSFFFSFAILQCSFWIIIFPFLPASFVVWLIQNLRICKWIKVKVVKQKKKGNVLLLFFFVAAKSFHRFITTATVNETLPGISHEKKSGRPLCDDESCCCVHQQTVTQLRDATIIRRWK